MAAAHPESSIPYVQSLLIISSLRGSQLIVLKKSLLVYIKYIMATNFDKTPVITNSLSALLAQSYNAQLSPYCANFELKAIECYEAYGFHGAAKNKLCQDYMDDLKECLFKIKTALRYHEMQDERRRQYKAGLRKEQFAPTPNQDHE